VCGVSAAIAIAATVSAKKEDAPIAITTVIIWAIAVIFVLPFIAQALHLTAPSAAPGSAHRSLPMPPASPPRRARLLAG
jgi:uncharacterized membrane protein YadS